MKFAQTLTFAALATIVSASGAFAQDSTQLDMSQVQGGETMYVGITEAATNDGSAFAAGMIVNPEYGAAISIDAQVLNASKEEFGTETAADGSVLVNDSAIEKTISAGGSVNFGNKVENVKDIDGGDTEVEGNSTSTAL